MPKFPVDAPIRKVIAALERLGFNPQSPHDRKIYSAHYSDSIGDLPGNLSKGIRRVASDYRGPPFHRMYPVR
jgi:hypothetical protein